MISVPSDVSKQYLAVSSVRGVDTAEPRHDLSGRT